MIRVGIGHDTHRLAADRPLILGSLTIDSPRGLVGHSDADVVLHALTDALLGAVGLGDIGDAYPDTDPANKDRDSRDFLALSPGSRLSDITW
jgi:2-C-methyl-D-erythritol 2,4-cyclodiphosphate synthase